MGMDIYGNSDTYFRANLWSWRPIHLLCDVAIQQYNLDMNTDGWSYNDGCGLDTQDECDVLANKLELLLIDNGWANVADEERVYLCLGMWCTQEGGFVEEDVCNQLNEQFPEGTLLLGGVIHTDGKMYEPSHSTSIGHLREFIKFLRKCEGFKIY